MAEYDTKIIGNIHWGLTMCQLLLVNGRDVNSGSWAAELVLFGHHIVWQSPCFCFFSFVSSWNFFREGEEKLLLTKMDILLCIWSPNSFFFFFCSEFCHTLKWNSHGFTWVPHPDPPSHLPLHLLPLGLPSAPGPSACVMHPTWAGDLFHSR